MPSEALPLQLEKGDSRKLEPGTVVIGVITIDGHDKHIEVTVGNDKSLTALEHLLQVCAQLYNGKATSSTNRVRVLEIILPNGQLDTIPDITHLKFCNQPHEALGETGVIRTIRVFRGSFSLWHVGSNCE